MPLVQEREETTPSPRRRWTGATGLALVILLLLLAGPLGMIFFGGGLQLGNTFLVGQFGTVDTMGTGIPQGFYTEFYRSTDLELPLHKFKGPYSARIATVRLGPLTAGVGVANLSDSRPMPGE